MKLHVSGEDYLEAILVLQKKSGMVRSIDLARHMGFSKPSISHAVGVLKKEGLRNKRSSRGEQNRKKKQEIIWLKKKSCKMTDFSLLPVIPPEVHRMVSPGRKWG
jgi:Mn-dependent DtxR family transcriptional regulator